MNTSQHMIFGMHAVKAALQSERSVHLLLLQDALKKKFSSIVSLAEARSVPIKTVSKAELEQCVGTDARHQGIVAQVDPIPMFDDVQSLLRHKSENILLLVLDGVTDPHNLGACIRTADAAGVDAVILPKDKSAQVNATVRKVACGAVESMPIITVTNVARTLDMLQKAGVWITGTDDAASQSIYEVDFKGNVAFVMGSEGKGLRQLTKQHCDFLAYIPMQGSVESLNVSVATGICLFEAIRQRC